jgi:hypothetical protein
VTKMKPRTCVKDIQKQTRCMAALSHFISHDTLRGSRSSRRRMITDN